MRLKRAAFAILRFDDFQGEGTPMENRVTVVQVRLDLAAAEAEVERLNSLNEGKGSRYKWQTTRLIDGPGLAKPEPALS